MTNGISSQTLKRLEEWVTKEACSSRFLDFYKSLLLIQAEVEGSIVVPKPELKKETVNDRMASGKPLLKFDELDLDWSLVEDTFNRVVATFGSFTDLFGPVPEGLLKSKRRQKLNKKITKAWFEAKSLPADIAGEDISEPLLINLIQQTLRPFLISHSQALISLVSQEGWRRGYCPICGGGPDIAFLEKEVGERWLMCSRCDTQWRFQRLECPSCGNQDPKSLPFFSDDKGLYRLYVCEKCHTYLKAVDLRNAKTEIFLPLERLMTLDMDQQGQKMGYLPGYAQLGDSDTARP